MPFRWTTAKEVMGDFVDIRAEIGLAEDISFMSAVSLGLRMVVTYSLVKERDA